MGKDDVTNPDNRSPIEEIRDDMRAVRVASEETRDYARRQFELTLEIRETLGRRVERLELEMDEVKVRLRKVERSEPDGQ